jgi:hypothetical protein
LVDVEFELMLTRPKVVVLSLVSELQWRPEEIILNLGIAGQIKKFKILEELRIFLYMM